MAVTLSGGVGIRRITGTGLPDPTNAFEDQTKVVGLLRAIPASLGGMQEVWSNAATAPTVSLNNQCPQDLADAIFAFQTFWRDRGVFHRIDGVVDPGQHTLAVLNDLATRGASAGGLSSIPPEGQIDATACWAASLSWLSRAATGGTPTPQLAIIGANSSSFGASGTISFNDLMTANAGGVLMKRKRITPGELEPIIRAQVFPLLVAFRTGPMSGHVNVIHGFDPASSTVVAMEPWFPDASLDTNFTLVNVDGQLVYENNTTGAPFAFTGNHIKRPMTYYTSKPLDGAFVVGIPANLDFPP